MKKVFFIAIFFCAAYASQAQVYVGGSLSAWNEKVNDVNHTSVNFYPEIGYGFGNNWHAGVVIGFGQTKAGDVKEDNYRFTPYIGYTFYENQIDIKPAIIIISMEKNNINALSLFI